MVIRSCFFFVVVVYFIVVLLSFCFVLFVYFFWLSQLSRNPSVIKNILF